MRQRGKWLMVVALALCLVGAPLAIAGVLPPSITVVVSGTPSLPATPVTLGGPMYIVATLEGPEAPYAGTVTFHVNESVGYWPQVGDAKTVSGMTIVSDPYFPKTVGPLTVSVHYVSPEGCHQESYGCVFVAPFVSGETAWAGEAVGIHRFVPPPGNWATYVYYTIGGTGKYDLYAGQNHLAGTVGITTVGQELRLDFQMISGDSSYHPGFIGDWSIATLHLALDGSTNGIPQTKKGIPIPGQFEFHRTGGGTQYIPIGGHGGQIVLAIHADVSFSAIKIVP